MAPKVTWVVFYTCIAQLMTHAANVYIAAAYFAVMFLCLLAYCKSEKVLILPYV